MSADKMAAKAPAAPRLFRATADDYYDAPLREFPAAIRAVFYAVALILMAFSKLMWRWSFADAAKLDEAREGGSGVVVICNHTSMAEVVPIFAYWRLRGRPLRLIMKSEFTRNPIVRWAFSRAGAIPVDRGKADVRSVRRAQRALQRGEDVFIFPEGTRIRTDDQPVEVHGGFALMASMAKAAIAPMAVCGFRDVTPNGKRLMRPVTCWLKAGDAVRIEDAPLGLKRSERMRWAEDEAARRMYALRDELRAEHPGRR